jgi:hypothetical protein
MDSGTGRVGEGHARVETTQQHLHYSLTYRVSQGMDSGTGRVGKGHACVETAQQHLHVVHLPIG